MKARIIVAGGIGSGKTAFLRQLEALGAYVIHADEIGHFVLEHEQQAFDEVAEKWPGVVVDGRIDRQRLAKIVFDDLDQLDELEAITHPLIRKRIEELLDGREGVVAVEVPLITDFLGPGWTRVVVDAPEETRRRRAIDRGMDPEDVAARMRAQPSQLDWLASADVVIDNSGDQSDLEAEAKRLISVLRP